MTRLGLLIVLLAVVIAAAVVVQLRVAPDIALSSMASAATAKKLSGADQQRLDVLKTKFVEERDAFLKLRNAGASADQVNAQHDKANEAAQAVIALGGQEALKSVGQSKYASKTAPTTADAAATCSGEEGGSCSGEGGACSVDLGDKAPKEAKAEEAEPAAEPAAPTKP